MSTLRLIAMISVAVPTALLGFGFISWLAALVIAIGIASALLGIWIGVDTWKTNGHEYGYAIGMCLFFIGPLTFYMGFVKL